MSGYCTYKYIEVEFVKGDIRHKSRCLTYWNAEKVHSVTLLTNNFKVSGEDIIEIYRRIWPIELLFKQLKQNFPLEYFYGDSVNAIKSQIAASGTIDGIVDYANEWVGGAGVHVGIGTAGALADEAALRIPPESR